MPATGGTDAPSSTLAQPLVVSSFGASNSPSLELRAPINRPDEAIYFEINTPAPRYLIEYDVWIEALPLTVNESFSLTARMDEADFRYNSFDLRGGGHIGGGSHDSDRDFGSYTPNGDLWPFGQVMHVSADIDFAHDFWTVRLDGNQIWAREFAKDPGAQLTSVEFLLHTATRDGTSAGRIDNIVISAIPEPSTNVLAAVGICCLVARRFQARAKHRGVDKRAA